MPIPSPRKGEKQEAFVSRCHSSIAKEYPDSSQRHAICMQKWRDRHKKADVSLDDAHMAAFLTDDPRCFASYLGPWAIEPVWFQQAIDALKMGFPVPQAQTSADRYARHAFTPTEMRAREAYTPPAVEALDEDDVDDAQAETPYHTTHGVGIIRIVGQMQKGHSKFGGVSTILTRRALRLARADPAVKAILLAIDSPGGMVAGTPELAQEVTRTGAVKPVRAYIEDLGASAAYWVASQAESISANATAQIGSIGVMAILHDSSGLAERSGLAVHVVSTGAFKGMGAPGSKVLPEHLSEIATQVEDLGAHFFQAVQEGRSFSASQMARVSDGRVWIAEKARQMGLINKVQSFDEALAELVRMRPRSGRTTASLEAELAAIPRIPQGG